MSTETLDNIWMPPASHNIDTSAEQRARLIREMAGSKRSRSSLDSGSIRDDDGLPRGGGWDTNSQDLPAAPREPDFQINTSALRRAFPDFSQHGSSTEDSIELGRGYKRNSARNTPSKNPPSEDVSEALPFSFGKGAKYQLTGTPPIKPRASRVENKENEQPKKETRTGSGSSGKGSYDSHKTLVDRYATVEDVDDSVVLQEMKSSKLNNQATRNTRFASGANKETYYTPATHKHQQRDVSAQNNTHTSMLADAPATNQSYIIPDMPNITELITGHRQDGTPIFNRSVKSRSRFTTPANRRSSIKVTHAPVEIVPVPADTKALYVSLQLLQEKVAELEGAKDRSEQKLEEYELEVLQLRSKLEEQEHAKDNNDSGLGSDVEDGKVKDLRDEKTKLETALHVLQERLDRATRKANKAEAKASNLSHDRDALHAQLGLAYLHAQDDDETQALTGEVKQLRKELSRVTRDHEKRMQQLNKQEVELRGKIERREKAINQMASLAKELYNTRIAVAAVSEYEVTARSIAEPSLHLDKLRRSGNQILSSRRVSSRHERRQSMRTDHIHAYESEEDAARSDAESTTHIHLHSSQELAKDDDFRSFMDGDEVEMLRFVVADEKAKLGKLGGQGEIQREDTVTRDAALRKSSMKKVSYADLTNTSVAASRKNDATHDLNVNRQDTQQSGISQTSERRRRSAAMQDELTSAFLVPDVTLRQHDGQATTNTQATAKQTTTVRRPVPVSDRMPHVEDATVRPAQDPAVALATIIQNLEDEVSTLRTQLAEQENLYHKHDPALSKRKRKIVFSRIQKLLAAIETRADQIYALYDVLEGQKASGQMMKEEEVEVTLQNIGLDPKEVLNKKLTKKATVEDDASDGLASDAESDDEYPPPWEGMDPTQTQDLDDLGRLSVR